LNIPPPNCFFSRPSTPFLDLSPSWIGHRIVFLASPPRPLCPPEKKSFPPPRTALCSSSLTSLGAPLRSDGDARWPPSSPPLGPNTFPPSSIVDQAPLPSSHVLGFHSISFLFDVSSLLRRLAFIWCFSEERYLSPSEVFLTTSPHS